MAAAKDALADANGMVRAAAVRAALEEGTPDLAGLAATAGRDPDPEVRRSLVRHVPLASPTGRGAVRAALGDPDPLVRRAALRRAAAADVDCTELWPGVRARLHDGDQIVCELAVLAAPRCGKADAVGNLIAIAAAEERGDVLREAAVRALGALGAEAKEALLPLRKLETDATLGPAARDAARRIEGTDR
jgi:hypothetical protein